MELYAKKTGNYVHKFVVAEGGSRCVITDDEDGTGKVVVVATPDKVICYLKVPAEEQFKDVLRKKDFLEATSLAEELHDDGEITNETLSLVHAQAEFLLMFDLHFEEAVNHFLLSETMQPSEIFPFIMPDPNRWSLLVAHSLSRAVNLDSNLARLEERSRLVQINDESQCDSCHARLGTKLFAMYPDDTIVCYKGKSTSVTGRDFDSDPVFKPGWLVTE